MVRGNIWGAALQVCIDNWKWIVAYVGGALVLSFVKTAYGSTGGLIWVDLLLGAMVAIPAHLSMLRRGYEKPALDAFYRKNRNLLSFVWRSFLLGLMSFAPALLALFFCAAFGAGKEMAIIAVVLVMLLSACVVFAVWGTMLPALVLGDDRSFGAALRRSSRSFGYALPRLPVPFVVLTVLQTALAWPAAELFGAGSTGAAAALVALAISAAVGAFQFVMVAVILSRSYLLAQPRPLPPSRPQAQRPAFNAAR